ncbi:hypothetical protein HY449_02670 [Candidatus Pacearchaeota archaeon]|nr:hypothetical protein [Candidatus Pacearchaeota archaeon]
MARNALIVGASSLILSGCGNREDAIKSAESEGWKNVEILNPSISDVFKCGEGELAYRIKGLNPRDKPSEAIMCYGMFFKGYTIRH